MFAKKLYQANLSAIEAERDPSYRVQNIGWPSESLASLGKFNVGECRRKLFYKILGTKYTNPPKVRIKTICDAGIMYENYYVEQFKRNNMLVSGQSRIEFEMPGTSNKVIMSGKTDLLIRDDRKFKLIECKTVHGYKADMVFGTKGSIPLPAVSNLMQAMAYKWYSLNNKIDGMNVSEMYLMYINRGDGTVIYFKIDLTQEGYSVITPILMDGTQLEPIDCSTIPGYDVLSSDRITHKAIEARIADLKVKTTDIFEKFDTTYYYARNKVLPPKDYSILYDDETLNLYLKVGKLSKQKYNKHKKGEQKCGDFNCTFCPYLKRCLSDDGINLK